MIPRARITVRLTDDEWEALLTGAREERRDPRDQAGLFVREGLQRAGYLQPMQTNNGGIESTQHSPLEVTR